MFNNRENFGSRHVKQYVNKFIQVTTPQHANLIVSNSDPEPRGTCPPGRLQARYYLCYNMPTKDYRKKTSNLLRTVTVTLPNRLVIIIIIRDILRYFTGLNYWWNKSYDYVNFILGICSPADRLMSDMMMVNMVKIFLVRFVPLYK